jgi:hypothetical protein
MIFKDDLAERLKAKLVERNGSLLSDCVPGMLYHVKVRCEKHDFEWQTTPRPYGRAARNTDRQNRRQCAP